MDTSALWSYGPDPSAAFCPKGLHAAAKKTDLGLPGLDNHQYQTETRCPVIHASAWEPSKCQPGLPTKAALCTAVLIRRGVRWYDRLVRGFEAGKTEPFHAQHPKQKHPQAQAAGVDKNVPSQSPLH